MKSHVEVQIFPDLMAISQKAAEMFVLLARASISEKGRFAVAISGGSTPKRFYSLLGSAAYRDQIDWPSVHFFWADERCVPKEDEENNFKLASETFLSRVPVPDRNIHRIKGEKGPEVGTKDYGGRIRSFFGTLGLPVFDLILLGMGEDGHTASLFPGSKVLQERGRPAVPVYLEKPGVDRITVTLPVLNRASQIIFLVSGSSKAGAVRRVLEEEEMGEQLPASLIRPLHGSVTWLIDEEAAGKLVRESQSAKQ
jgi:6-phosphogluconolactonase